MEIKQLFIIDPLDKLNVQKDTSILIMNEALKRGHKIYICTEESVTYCIDKLYSKAYLLTEPLTMKSKDSVVFSEKLFLDDMDFIHIRKDPPFDSNYLTLSLLMKHVKGAKVVNDPESLLKFNEKEAIFNFPEFITETLISSREDDVRAFMEEVGGDVVLKPLFNCSGKGVQKLSLKDEDLSSAIKSGTIDGSEKVVIQKFLPQIYEGETRVFMLEDKPLAVMKKIPKEGSFLGNFDFGAKGVKYSLNEEEKKLCSHVGKFCKEHGIWFSALDIIGGCLSEFNITSPGLLYETKTLNSINYESEVVSFLEQKLSGKGV